MKYTLATLALGGLAPAAGIPRDTYSCKFTIAASGGQPGIVGQPSDGQNRIGGGNPTGEYCINNGQITDSQGRGCILTPPTTQFQCDTGAIPTSGFSLGSNGHVEYNGSPTFYACPATDSMYNIYTTPVSGQKKCVEVQLTASGCYAPQSATMKTSPPISQTQKVTIVKTAQAVCPAPQTSTVTRTIVKAAQAVCRAPSTITVTQSAAAQPTSSKPASQPATEASSVPPASTGKTCPTNLNGAYQYPHLIVPTSSYTFSGNGEFDFTQLNKVASQNTDYANMGSVKTDFGVKTVTPGSAVVVSTFACPAGQAISYEISSASGSSLNYFQDYNPSPIGLYITSC